ncbi:hypothetical protein [Mesorhizobium sp. B2-3-12]|uniref:hypothetical protein n=1 Tax=Mesorhizobium sp. B2-3-12 TaxID=2589952 RepID=UPI0015E2E5C8|nr:hypothetical protein [Mesorhizobium sp. B2-3-12]
MSRGVPTYAIRHGVGFLLVMGNIDEGHAGFLMQPFEFAPHGIAQRAVERRQRFSREYKRLFGEPPRRDAEMVKTIVETGF